MASTASSKRKQQQSQAVLRIVILAAILFCINLLASRFHAGIDLTREKRFTLSASTKKQLKKLNEVVVVDVYLKGKDFPAGFKRLADATREKLQSFQDVAGSKILFRFVDPFEGKSQEEKGNIFRDLASRGIYGVNLQVEQGASEGYSEKVIFPWALVQYKGRYAPVSLLENHQGMSSMEVLNVSETLLEYKLANAIHQLDRPEKPTIAYILGHGESIGPNTFDALKTLHENYNLDTFDITVNYYIPSSYSAIIINKPTLPFDDQNKFKIDQYIMNGGKVLWCLDMLNTPMDSLVHSETFLTQDYNLNLDDQLFRYGVRANNNLIEDLRCNRIPVQVGVINDRPDIQLRPWVYFPVFLPTSRHQIVNNMDAVMGKFVGSIDTIGEPGIRKTVLLESSQYSRVAASPIRVSLSMLRYQPRPELFNKPFQPVAVLLEGRFQSIFKDRMHPQFLQLLRDSLKREFKPLADTETSMIVISDGDMFNNDYTMTDGPYEMGFWRFDKAHYANKTFLLNCLEYLTDPESPLEARSKDLRLRLLDGGRVKKERTKWQLLNLAIPLGLVLVFASAYTFFRKRRYEGQ